MPRVLAVVLSLLALACGKRRVGPPSLGDAEAWDPPTAANGFRPVAARSVLDCGPDRHPGLALADVGRSEAVAKNVSARVLGGDGAHAYWVEGDSPSAIVGAVRSTGHREVLARDEVAVGDLAVGRTRVYWTAGRAGSTSGAIRFVAKAGGAAGTLAMEPERPGRIVERNGTVYWLTPPNHVRHALGGGEPRELMTVTVLPNLLAVGSGHVFVFKNDRSLLRIEEFRAGRASVLVPTTEGAPVDLAEDGGMVYWLESGLEGGCPHCTHGYELGSRGRRGALRSIAAGGGEVQTIASDLVDVESFAVRAGIVWLTTRDAVFRIDPGRRAAERVVRIDGFARRVSRPVAVPSGVLFAARPPTGAPSAQEHEGADVLLLTPP